MFESHVLHLLRRYLGEYVHGLSAEALRISVWKGDVIFKDLKLKAEALNSLKLPVTVKAGFVGTITLKVPWKSLGKEPVIVLIDRVFILAHPASDGRTFKEEDRESLFEVKMQQIEEAEAATLEAVSRSKLANSGGSSWLSSLIATIIGNLKISISNVHIRYEDSVSNKGHPFASGMTLAKLAAVTTDESGNETFDTSGALDKLRKSLQLERLALYHDSDSMPWKINKKWEDLSSQEWIEIFEDGINVPATDHGEICKWAMDRTYVVSPINGALKYHRLGNQERNDPEVPFEKASLVLTDVSLTIFEAQYHDWIKLFEAVSRYKTYIEIAHLRPVVPVSQGSHLWWCYAARASLQQKQLCYRFSWDQIKQLCQLRRRYVQLYASFLQHSDNVKNSEVREIEKDLDSKVILLWRLLAHAKVETVKSKKAAEQRRNRNKSWFLFGWPSSSGDVSESPELAEGGLTKEEWQAINNFLSYQPDEDATLHSGKDMQNMIKFLVTISIGQAAARIISVQETEILCGRFEELHVSTKFRLRNIHCDVLLKFYGLSSPEGSLAQSVCSEQKENALTASFVQSPVGEDVDWKLSATISPCHATVWMESYERFLEFVKRSNAISPRVAMETATALQMKFEKVTRRAQEQFQMVLEEQSRFALDIDFGAPKVRVPIRACTSTQCDGHFLLDFGHFSLYTKESHAGDHSQNLYSRFYVSGRDIAAFFIDSGSDCQSGTSVMPTYNSVAPSLPDASGNCYSIIDRCGMVVIVDQIKGPHPSYPSTRISVQVPNLGIHFSPARYQRLMELMNILYGRVESSSEPVSGSVGEDAPWSTANLSANARILVWKGIGKSVASWQPCYVVLSGLYLYVMETEKSISYQRFLSMAHKQVLEVPPSNVGGSNFCIAVSFRGMSVQKALESSSTWVIELKDEEEKTSWMKGLVQATYQASSPPSGDVLEDLGGMLETDEPSAMGSKTADFVVNGALVETNVFIYAKNIETQGETSGKPEETLILEILAGGGKIHVTCWESDLTVKMKLHSLKIKDELQGRMSKCQYLACSVLKNDHIFTLPNTSRLLSKEFTVSSMEEDDIFDDALPEFMCLSESIGCSQNLDVAHAVKTANNHQSVKTQVLEALLPENDFGKGKDASGEIFYETEGSDNSDFVSVSFSTRSPSSPDYNGVDTQMNIRMSKLEFFCNRPTLVALIALGIDLSSVNSWLSNMEGESANDDSLPSTGKKEDNGHAVVKGLLGHGKGRVIFNLNMNVDSVSVFLNKEDDSQLAMFVQESFLLDLKVHPSSLSIEGTLGNFRLCDMSLGVDHRWGWLCDIRKPGVESLIKFTFKSYGVDDDDYEGYDYSLFCRLSTVRIVFLYRFVQEVTAYFMELVTPHTEEAIKLVDKVGDFEWLIQKYEIDGSTAVKLDLSLDTPIIIVPRNSVSKDFIQLDLGKLRVTNEFSWHGSPGIDPSSVHIDILHAEILGINMSVGFETFIGKPMIRECHGFDVYVRRSLRDIFRKVPTFALEVKVDLLHAVMSDKEYNVILDCTYMNLNEQPRIPPSFRDDISGSKETIRLLADKVNTNSQMLLSRNVTIMAVEVKYALLELCNGIDEESPLAHIALDGLWVSYRITSLSETDLYVTIPKFSIVDIRPDTKPEMRLMLGSATDASKQVSGVFPFSLNRSGLIRMTSEGSPGIEPPNSTMFLMDYRWRVSSQSFVVRIQQPRVLVVPDFLLAVGEFFVPALGAMTGREEIMDPKNDPITRNSSIILSQPIYKQTEEVVHLSPSKQLVIDTVGVDDYTYDGCGKIICLSEGALEKEDRLSRSQPIIIIGHGKRLRFVNVKIENGYLLRKYTYLSNDSSYSVSADDGVDISLLDHFTSDSEKKSQTCIDYSSETCNTSEVISDKMESRTFEAQVVSPEFTFYDGTKSSLDDTIIGEKLLRAKMDLSFMYASKERDTWIRALVKDLMVESGSGLIVLDPVDLSGGYTSVKDKTSISVVSTDMCIHLSLSVISLVLSLHKQAAAALQFSNANPLALCTNFERLWVSPRENGAHNNLTFWRPRAPSNYVILGDCVTSRPVPPSQSVIAVSNTYGRVRKPLGFKLIGSFSGIQGLACGEGSTTDDCDCSLWMPVAPPGYKAMGCVAAVGDQPPPNHIVYCLREDLVASAPYSECILSVSANAYFSSGFSIWRLDNVLRSFCAHPSSECPSKNISYDISHILLWNSNRHHSSAKEYTDASVDDGFHSNQKIDKKTASSGWDMLRSISRASNYFTTTPNFERIWWDKGRDIRRAVSIWRPIAHPDYAIVGDCITEGLEPPALGIIFKAKNVDISARPVQFTKVAHIMGKGAEDVWFWYPIAPPGYVSVGCIVTRTDEMPLANSICCPRMDLVNQGTILEVPITRSSSSRASHCWSIWKVENQAHTFLARSDLKKPSSRLAYTIGDYVKPKKQENAQENLTVDMKLRCFSLTILDSLCGMMTPIFDTTITNIKIATHGRPEAMDAVLVSSIAASTFNTQLEAWEPLVEPFDGIFKFETYDTGKPQSRLGMRVRVAATNTLNMNASAASLETFAETIISWRRQIELEEKAARLNEELGTHSELGRESAFSALDEDDFQTVIIENKLGIDIYLKKLEQNADTVEVLHHNTRVSIWIPPPTFSDRLNVADQSGEARHYVSVQILEAKDLPIIDDGNSHNFFCALRVIAENQTTDQQKLFPQSSRTKSVKPIISDTTDAAKGSATWNELFIFEVPRMGTAKLEIEVTNLAAKAGKGEVVGAFSFVVGHGTNTLKKVASGRILQQSNDMKNVISYPLQRRGQSNNDEHTHESACLLVSTTYFEKKRNPNLQRDSRSEENIDRDIGFWVGLKPEDKWESFRSLLPLSVVPKVLNNEFMAMEVFMENGKKHAIFRGLATVVNYTDANLDLSVYHESVIENQNSIHARQQLSGDDKSFSEGFLSSLAPESSATLPWRSTFRDSDQCFQVRPAVDLSRPSYLWGRVVAVSSADSFGKDQFFVDQSLLYNDPTKRGNKVSNLFKLNQLEKKDVLLCCRPSSGSGSKLFWLSIGADASALHTELNAPVYDWKICINSPLKLENHLPCPAEFTIWEKTKDGTTIEREQGILSSRKSVNIYSADIQKALYLSLFVQGGWVLEREPVPLLDLSSNNHVSSFWMVHQQSHRRLRISIERDMGGTTAAPKTIRFFVPYWIVNDCSLPLAYQLVELESADSADTDLFLSRTVKSAKTTFSAVSMEKRRFGSRKNIQMLEIIGDTSPIPSMLSPRDYASRSGGTLFPSRGDSFVSPWVGIAVAVRNSHNFSPGISLLELEKKEHIDVNAFKPDGSYYKLSALLNMTSDRTKVICFQPQILFVNRVGCSVCLRQCDSQMIEWIHPTDPPKPFAWDSSAKFELLKLRVDGYEWSSAFSVSTEGLMSISLKRVTGNEQLNLKVAVRGATKNSRYDVVICPYSFSSPYRIENRSMFLPLHFRQVDDITDSWRPLLPNSSASFIWEDLGRRQLLEVLIGGVDPAKSETFNIDEISDHQAIHVDGKALCVTVLKEGKTNIVRFRDWMPENEFGAVKSGCPPTAMSPHFINNLQHQNSLSTSTGEFHFIVELPELGFSIIDHTPEEILYLSIQNLLLSYSSGLGSEISRFKIRMCGIQLDNQLPLSPMPVLFRLQTAGEETDYVLKFSMTMQSNGSPDLCVYPYIGLHGPENSAFVINIHEPIIWRLHEMIQQVNLKRLQDTQETAVSVDPIIQIGVLNISEVRLKVSMAMSPTQRPRGVLGFWASLMTALGNTENMPVKINPRFHENVSMRQSTMVNNAISNVQKDLLSQPLQLLSGVDILGNASSALGHMSKGVAALSMDKKFIQSRQRQENKGVEHLGDVIREGGGALAKGLFRGVTGILTKPLEGAKSSGVEGFVQGVGKGIIGAAAQPVSGVLDLLSKTTEGANAVRMKIASALTSEEQLLRKRLPRVIGGDNLLRPYNDYKSEGQVILQLAESGSFLGQVDLFKVRGKFALSDAYEDHFLLPKGKILMVTHRRVILLQQPSNIINQRKFSPARDPCSVVWDVMWDTLMFMELAYGKKDHPKAPHSRLILYLQTRSTDSKDQIRIIKCIRESHQAADIYTSIQQALNTYGPNKSMGMLKRKVTKPYSPIGDTTTSESTSKECGGSFWLPQQVPSSVSLRSTFCSSTN